jgi:hypothetical protein
MQGVATKSVELPHHDDVTVANVIEQGSQTWTVIPCTRHDVGEGLRHASSDESCVLLLQRLGDGADSHITYAHPTTRWCGCMRISVCHKGTEQPRREFYSQDDFLFRDRVQFCSRLVDLVVGVGRDGGGGHRLTLAGERFVGLVAEDIA